MSEQVLVECDGPVMTVTIHRPPANAIDLSLSRALYQAFPTETANARIKWMFTTERARAKMGRTYPQPPPNSGQTQRVKTTVQRY